MKRIVSILLVVIMILGAAALVACGEKNNEIPAKDVTVESASWKDGKLCLIINGKEKLYARQSSTSEMFTPDLPIAEFAEELEWEGIIWTVYSVKEKEDLSVVFAISGTNSVWVCIAE